jgi:carbon monoxide dehydrogenase subunit G
MKIDNEFTVNVPIQRAWDVLTDLEGIAPCLPGAQLTGVDGDVYTGKAKIKVGPVVSEYAGTAQFREKDDSAYHAVIDAKGKDSRGAGNVNAAISAQLHPDGERTRVAVSTDLNITGKIAQFGSGVIKEVSEKLLGEFVNNLEAKLLVPEVPAGLEAAAEAAAAAGGAAAPAVSGHRVIVSETEPEPLDLMSIAGSSIYKRAIPVAIGAAVVVAVVIYLIVR